VSRLVLGDAGARQRSASEDHQLARAIALLSTARSQDALFAAGRTSVSVARPATGVVGTKPDQQ
jgi:hypothetical protein